jgi:hypothetical protein
MSGYTAVKPDLDVQALLSMHPLQIARTSAITITLLLSLAWSGSVLAQSTDDKPKPDNTAVNKRDQTAGEATADKQKMNA